MKPIYVIAGVLILVLSACGAPAAPAIDPAMVQASAVAAANTMVALTQSAMPTDTPTAEPSPTVLPSPTLAPLPTLPPVALTQVVAPTPSSGGGQGNCVHTLNMAEAGPTHRTQIFNQTGGTINISLNLYKPNKFGQCGSISYGNITNNATVMANLPEGYWFAYAWTASKTKNFTVTGSFYVQPAVFDKLELCVRTALIKYTPQC